MVKRRNLKEVHENAVLIGFGEYLKSQGVMFKILEKPDPPEAIVIVDDEKTWIEITDAFLDRDHAIGVTSGAAEDVVHKRDDKRLIIEPSATFRNNLINVISKKYDKDTMKNLRNELGGGVLLVGIFTPFSTARDIMNNEIETIKDVVSIKSCKVFDQIYVYDGYGEREFCRIY